MSLSVTGSRGADALSTVASEHSRRQRAVVVLGHAHLGTVPQHQTHVVRTTAFRRTTITTRCADVRTAAVVVLTRITACNPRPPMPRIYGGILPHPPIVSN